MTLRRYPFWIFDGGHMRGHGRSSDQCGYFLFHCMPTDAPPPAYFPHKNSPFTYPQPRIWSTSKPHIIPPRPERHPLPEQRESGTDFHRYQSGGVWKAFFLLQVPICFRFWVLSRARRQYFLRLTRACHLLFKAIVAGFIFVHQVSVSLRQSLQISFHENSLPHCYGFIIKTKVS